MHIKTVTIRGFKSYNGTVKVPPFSSGHNVIVGRNGSGKSNFFNAIRFLLSDTYTNLRHPERQALLHEGAGSNVLQAHVEIVFDNSSERFPVDEDEVVLGRTIGLKKDEYFLNRKHMSKGDVINLLESAGFSRSNPYYIVQQGKVNALCLMKDKERLDLLKEVAGTRVYEDRRAESMKIMAETNGRRQKIQEVSDYIDERLEELEEEKEELKEYQQLDRERRALEYTLYDKELQSARNTLENLEITRAEEAERANDLHLKASESRAILKAKEKELKILQADVRKLSREQEVTQEDRSEIVARRAKLELEVRDAEDRVAGDSRNQARLAEELQIVQHKIDEAQRELQTVAQVRYDAAEAKMKVSGDQLRAFEARVSELHSRQGRISQFRTTEERNEWLQTEISQVESAARSKLQAARDLRKNIQELQSQLARDEGFAATSAKEIEHRRLKMDESDATLETLRGQRNEAAENRKLAWRSCAQLEDQLAICKTKLDKGNRALQRTMARPLSRGLQFIEKYVLEHNIPGVHGPLIELFNLSAARFATAVEAAAGNSLFHVVVDTDETAARLMKALERHRAGRVTFVPLNRIHYNAPEYPASQAVAVPLIEKLEFEGIYRDAMQQVFGKTLICKDHSVASEFRVKYKLNCVTMDGDKIDRKGELEGGFIDRTTSRIHTMGIVRQARAELSNSATLLEKAKISAAEVEQRVTQIVSDMQKERTLQQHTREIFRQIEKEIETQRSRILAQKETISSKSGSLRHLEAGHQTLVEKANNLKEELKTPLLSQLSNSQQQELSDTVAEIAPLKRQLVALGTELDEARTNKTRLENLLEEHLLRRKREIRKEIRSSDANGSAGGHALDVEDRIILLKRKREALEDLRSNLEEASETLQEIADALRAKTTSISTLQNEIEELSAHGAEKEDELLSETKRMEKIRNKKSLAQQTAEDAKKRIRDLGTLPSVNFDEFNALRRKQLVSRIGLCNEKLKKFNHVNKKALDQFVNFRERREELSARHTELQQGAESIQQLIDHLDREKDEAIMRTFRDTAKHFREVFTELVPHGKGSLIMRTRQDQEDDISGDSDDAANESKFGTSVDTFIGVGVKVSFTTAGESFLMQQLSGGQKALVAMALIFAIQRCDPAPFYLFDEIDQALDATHRAAVANLIRRQASDKSSPAQFITSTFRPEMVQVADQFYGVSHQNKVSGVHKMDRAQTLEFIARIEEEEAAAPALRPRALSGGAAGVQEEKAAAPTETRRQKRKR